MITTLTLYALGAAAVAVSLPKNKTPTATVARPSIRRWPDMREWRGASPGWCRSTSTTNNDSFSADDAPDEIAAHAGALGSCDWPAELYRERFAGRRACTGKVSDSISDLQFTGALPRAVPVQPPRCAGTCVAGSFVQASSGVMVTDLDGNRVYDLTGSYGVNVFGYDFYKQCVERGAERVRDLGPVLGRLPSAGGGQREAAVRDLRARRSFVPHVRHRGGDAGGAPGALSHAAHAIWCASAAPITAGGATCSRASATRSPRMKPTP